MYNPLGCGGEDEPPISYTRCNFLEELTLVCYTFLGVIIIKVSTSKHTDLVSSAASMYLMFLRTKFVFVL